MYLKICFVIFQQGSSDGFLDFITNLFEDSASGLRLGGKCTILVFFTAGPAPA